jgi:hypothetical protein
MAVSLQSFFESSPLAGRIKLPTRIVIQRTKLSPGELMQIRESGRYGPIPQKQEICELEAGGRVLARGKIVRRRGEYYFKVLDSCAGGER